MTGSLESLPSSTAAPAQRGQIKGKEERSDTVMGHAGSEAAAWVCSNKPPSFFVVFQIQRSSWSPILGWWSLGGDGQSLWLYEKEEQIGSGGTCKVLLVLCFTPSGSFLTVPVPSHNIPAASINTDELTPPFLPQNKLPYRLRGPESHLILGYYHSHPHLPELGTCKSIFTSKSCTLNKSSERSLADLEFKSLSFPWPCNVKRKTNYKRKVKVDFK